MVTDTGGLLVGAEGHPADIQDREGRCGSSRRSTNCFPGWATCSPTASTTAPSCVMPSSNLVTGPSRSSNAPLMRPAFNCCRAAGWSNKPWPAQAKPTSGKGCRGIDCQRQSVGLCRLGTASSLEDWRNHCTTYLSYSTAIPIQIRTLSCCRGSLVLWRPKPVRSSCPFNCHTRPGYKARKLAVLTRDG